MPDAAQLLDGPFRHVRREGLAVPVLLVLDFTEALPLDRARDHDRRLGGRFPCLLQGLVDLFQVVAIDDDRPAAEGLNPVTIDIGLPFVFGWSPLAEAIDVENGGEVGEAVEAGLVQPLPDRAFGQLAIARKGPDVIREAVELATGERDSDGKRQALAK